MGGSRYTPTPAGRLAGAYPDQRVLMKGITMPRLALSLVFATALTLVAAFALQADTTEEESHGCPFGSCETKSAGTCSKACESSAAFADCDECPVSPSAKGLASYLRAAKGSCDDSAKNGTCSKDDCCGEGGDGCCKSAVQTVVATQSCEKDCDCSAAKVERVAATTSDKACCHNASVAHGAVRRRFFENMREELVAAVTENAFLKGRDEAREELQHRTMEFSERLLKKENAIVALEAKLHLAHERINMVEEVAAAMAENAKLRAHLELAHERHELLANSTPTPTSDLAEQLRESEACNRELRRHVERLETELAALEVRLAEKDSSDRVE